MQSLGASVSNGITTLKTAIYDQVYLRDAIANVKESTGTTL